MKRWMWIGLLVIAVALSSVGCRTIKAKRAKGAEPEKAKAENIEQAKVAEKAEAKEKKAEEIKAEAPCSLTKVKSSVLDAVGYDAASQNLTIVLKNGDTYEYHKVPQNVYKELMAASSKGKFFTKNIKDKYEYTKK